MNNKLVIAAGVASLFTVLLIGFFFVAPNKPAPEKITVVKTVVRLRDQPKVRFWPDERLLRELGPDIAEPFSGAALSPDLKNLTCHMKATEVGSLVILCV